MVNLFECLRCSYSNCNSVPFATKHRMIALVLRFVLEIHRFSKASPTSGVSYTFYINGQPVEASAVSGSVFYSPNTTLSANNQILYGSRFGTPAGCSSIDS